MDMLISLGRMPSDGSLRQSLIKFPYVFSGTKINVQCKTMFPREELIFVKLALNQRQNWFKDKYLYVFYVAERDQAFL
jgi:hypothetical protein